ncbi:hypothetical protein [Rothia nasimurium]|uniref:hypothetical protein n=1 Tax=Rothia nasimurium TaxID=85336 RepID=UPI001F1F1585|nr:hypothetical protein [Rothia nasimurium]
MGYVYRDPRRAENQPTVAPEPAPAPSAPKVPVHPKVKALLDDQKAKILELEAENAAIGKKLGLKTVAEAKAQEKAKALQGELDSARAELTAASESYDTLASVNQNLQEAVTQATDRAEKAEHEARLARAEADSPSAVKAIEELLDAEKEKTAKLTKHITNLKSQLGRAHQRIGAVHQEYEALLEGQDDGTVAVISAEGIELRGPYTEATVEEVAHTLDLAFKLFVQEGSNANIRAALG